MNDIHLYFIAKITINTYLVENVGEVLERNGYTKSFEGHDDVSRRQLNIYMLSKKEIMHDYVVLYITMQSYKEKVK